MKKKEADLFHWRYLNLFSNSESIPVYRNIAEEYKTDILETEEPEAVELSADTRNYAAEDQILLSKSEEMPEEAAFPDSESFKEEDDYGSSWTASPAAKSKKAVTIFESDESVQERIYSKAEEEGQQYLTRNIIPQISLTERKETPQTVIRSVYIESSKYFDEITSDSDYGIIPRTFDSTFILLSLGKKGKTDNRL